MMAISPSSQHNIAAHLIVDPGVSILAKHRRCRASWVGKTSGSAIIQPPLSVAKEDKGDEERREERENARTWLKLVYDLRTTSY
jgi:hypothetical protein